MRVAVVQMTSTDDVASNLASAAKFVALAADQGAELVALPENFAFLRREGAPIPCAQPLDGEIVGALREWARTNRIWLIGGTFHEAVPGETRVANTSVAVAPSGEIVAVYDPRRRWAMAAASSRIWNTTDPRAQPARPPTLVVHNGSSNPYQGAAVSVSVGAGPRSIEPDIRITQRNGRIRIETQRFTARLDAVAFRNEQTFLN